MSIIRVLAAFLCLSVFFFTTAHAAEINQEGAKKLKTLFEAGVHNAEKIGSEADSRYVFDGEVSVEPANGYYAVTLPYVTLTSKEFPDAKIGIIVVNVTPGKQEGQWNMAVALPSPILFIDNEGNTISQLDIGRQSMSGVWDEDLGNFTALRASYHNITLHDAEKRTLMRLPNAMLGMDSTRTETEGRWTGVSELNLDKLEISRPEISTTKIGRLYMKSEIVNFKPEFYKEMLYGDKQATPLERMEKALTDGADDLKLTYQLEKLDYAESAPAGRKLKIDALRLDGASLNLREDESDFDFTLNYAGLDAGTKKKKGTHNDSLIPINARADVKIDSIPLPQIIELAKNTLAQTEGLPPEETKNVMTVFILKIPALLSEAGSEMTAKDNFSEGPDYRVDFDTNVKADVTAMNSLTASGKAQVAGFDNILRRAGNMGPNIFTLLTKLKEAAKPATDKNGRAVDELAFSMEKNGAILINGQNIFAPAPAKPDVAIPEKKPEDAPTAKGTE